MSVARPMKSLLASVLAVALAFAAAAALAACGGSAKKYSAATAKMHPEAARKWSSLCVVCHAEDGSGQGEGSVNLNPRPRDFRSAKWQASVTDDHIRQVILKGGLAMKLSKDMPGNPELLSRPKVMESLLNRIRSFEGQP